MDSTQRRLAIAGQELRPLGRIGEGTYACVLLASICKGRSNAPDETPAEPSTTGGLCAIKIFKSKSNEVVRLAKREVAAHARLNGHPNIVHLRGAYRSGGGRPILVMEYCPRDVASELRFHPSGLPGANVKLLAWQLLQAFRYMHAQKILHRDVKPSNLLLTENGVLRVGDFGLAREAPPLPPRAPSQQQQAVDGPGQEALLTNYVFTRWYRAPEVLLNQPYGAPADIWSVGCTIAELATGSALLPGQSTVDQIFLIWRMFGGLPQTAGGGIAAVAAGRGYAPPRTPIQRSSLRSQLGTLLEKPLLELLEAALRTDPRERATAEQLLRMPYFEDVPALVAGTTLEGLYDWSRGEGAVVMPTATFARMKSLQAAELDLPVSLTTRSAAAPATQSPPPTPQQARRRAAVAALAIPKTVNSSGTAGGFNLDFRTTDDGGSIGNVQDEAVDGLPQRRGSCAVPLPFLRNRQRVGDLRAGRGNAAAGVMCTHTGSISIAKGQPPRPCQEREVLRRVISVGRLPGEEGAEGHHALRTKTCGRGRSGPVHSPIHTQPPDRPLLGGLAMWEGSALAPAVQSQGGSSGPAGPVPPAGRLRAGASAAAAEVIPEEDPPPQQWDANCCIQAPLPPSVEGLPFALLASASVMVNGLHSCCPTTAAKMAGGNGAFGRRPQPLAVPRPAGLLPPPAVPRAAGLPPPPPAAVAQSFGRNACRTVGTVSVLGEVDAKKRFVGINSAASATVRGSSLAPDAVHDRLAGAAPPPPVAAAPCHDATITSGGGDDGSVLRDNGVAESVLGHLSDAKSVLPGDEGLGLGARQTQALVMKILSIIEGSSGGRGSGGGCGGGALREQPAATAAPPPMRARLDSADCGSSFKVPDEPGPMEIAAEVDGSFVLVAASEAPPSPSTRLPPAAQSKGSRAVPRALMASEMRSGEPRHQAAFEYCDGTLMYDMSTTDGAPSVTAAADAWNWNGGGISRSYVFGGGAAAAGSAAAGAAAEDSFPTGPACSCSRDAIISGGCGKQVTGTGSRGAPQAPSRPNLGPLRSDSEDPGSSCFAGFGRGIARRGCERGGGGRPAPGCAVKAGCVGDAGAEADVPGSASRRIFCSIFRLVTCGL